MLDLLGLALNEPTPQALVEAVRTVLDRPAYRRRRHRWLTNSAGSTRGPKSFGSSASSRRRRERERVARRHDRGRSSPARRPKRRGAQCYRCSRTSPTSKSPRVSPVVDFRRTAVAWHGAMKSASRSIVAEARTNSAVIFATKEGTGNA